MGGKIQKNVYKYFWIRNIWNLSYHVDEKKLTKVSKVLKTIKIFYIKISFDLKDVGDKI